MDREAYEALYPEEFYNEYLNRGLRPDQRLPADCRTATASFDTVSSAASSALCRFGHTFVLSGTLLSLGSPAADAPDCGVLNIKVTVSCVGAIGRLHSEANDFAAQHTHVLQTHLLRPCVLDLQQLCIVPGRHCWHVNLDVYILNDDGNVAEAAMFAAVAALRQLQVPLMEVSVSGKLVPVVAHGEEVQSPLQLKSLPAAFTCGIYRGHIICDPTKLEEKLMHSTVTVVVSSKGLLLGVSVEGSVPVSGSMLQQIVTLAEARHKHLCEFMISQAAKSRDGSQAME